MPLALTNCLLNEVNGPVISTCRYFVSNQMPHPFLGIEFRMVRRQVFHLNFRMCGEEFFYLLTLVPGRSIDIKIYFPALDSVAQVFQKC